MIIISLLLTALLAMTSLAVEKKPESYGHFTVQLQLTGRSEDPVKTTLTLHGTQQEVTVTANRTTTVTLGYAVLTEKASNHEPIILDVSAATSKGFETGEFTLDRAAARVHELPGLLRIVSAESVCKKDWYGPWCSTWCRAIEGLRLRCDSEGQPICAEGWKGPNCDQRICKDACVHGRCDGVACRCRPGFTGPACDQCIPSAGCMGTCVDNKPGTCGNCRQGWTGHLCNIDKSLCSPSRSPCAAGFTCIVKSPGKTACVCPDGKTGANCTEVDPAARPTQRPCPCKNGGSCAPLTIRTPAPVCQCPLGFAGPTCETTVIVRHEGDSQSAINHNFVIALNSVLCLAVLGVAVFILIAALFIVRYAQRNCGGPGKLIDDDEKRRQQPKKMSSVSLLIPADLSSSFSSASSTPFSTPNHSSKGDDLFSAAKDHVKKSVVFDSLDVEPRYSACPKKSDVFSIPEPELVKEKTYESLPV